MKISRLPSAAIALCLCSAISTGQRARATHAERAFFAPRYLPELESPTNSGARVSGDLDNDGDVDLLTLRRNNAGPTGVQSWLNGGHGDLHYAHLLAFAPWHGNHFGGSEIATQVFLADVTGDDVLDLAYGRRNGNLVVEDQGVVVHPGLGDGSFGAGILVPANPVLMEFAVGDCDGDGDADVLLHEVNSEPTSRIAWWRLEGQTFVSGPSLVANGWQLTAADMNGDGIADALMPGTPAWSTIQLFLSVNGAPTLETILQLPSGIPFGLYRLMTGDLDGDGDEDALTLHADYSQSPFDFYFQPIRNDGAGFTFLPLQGVPQPQVHEGGDFLTTEGTLADWDADGDLDYVSPTFSWMENTGMAHFELAARQLSRSGGVLQVVDLDGDGHLDALTDHVCMFGDGHFPERSSTTPEPLGPFYSPVWRSLEDWDGDGDLDLAGGYLYLNNGDGTFVGRKAPSVDVPGVQGSPTEVGWGDFDGDGLRDVVSAYFVYPNQFERMVLFTGRDDGSFVLSPTVPSPVAMTAGVTGDFDGDGDLDILAPNGPWLNDGTGQFSESGGYTGLPLLARDIDADGDLDLLVVQNARLVLLRRNGSFLQATNLGPYIESFVPTFLDVDQDGDLDFVITQPADDIVSVREQLSTGAFAAPLEIAASKPHGPVGQIDVDGDGRLDLVVGLGDVGQPYRIAVWFRDEGLTFSEHREWVTANLPRAFGDLDRDGDVEPVGDRVFQNFRFDGPEDGFAVQYGLDGATSGAGGRHPILGSSGPVRPGQQVKLVLSGGRGGASGVLLKGSARADQPGAIRTLVDEPQLVRSFVLGGAPGVPGAGSIVLRTPVSSALVGLTLDYQAVLVDPGASTGLSATNGLEIRYGDWPKSR